MCLYRWAALTIYGCQVWGTPGLSIRPFAFYILFTNDLPDVIHTGHEKLCYKDPHLKCEPCGSLVTYVDDPLPYQMLCQTRQ